MDLVKSKQIEIKQHLENINQDGLLPDKDICQMDRLLAERFISNQIKSIGTKSYAETGNDIKYLSTKLGLDNGDQPGNYEIYSNNVLQLTKSIYKPKSKVDVNKLLEFLLNAGVSNDLLVRAQEHATINKSTVAYRVKKS